jgi:hypothetical protein
MVGIPNATTRIQSITYKMINSVGDGITKTSSTIKHMTGYDVALNLSMQGGEEDLKRLDVTIQFSNGTSGTIEISEFNILNSYRGFIKFVSDNIVTSTNPATTSTVAPANTFIPLGFGVKQIGIADYNKVEQSIHGYVEGEVAHIENIMAREFKEKSTRRLRRNETTETFSTETEREQLTDTSTADRFEMQSEVAKVIAQSRDFAGGVNSTTNWGGGDGSKTPSFNLNVNSNYATHNSTEESTRQAVTNAKEITERALDRIVSKVKEERVVKILEEFEENNSHGFDNRKGDKHVVGVYRWVDKVLKNQIVNYGKRLMFEFMIPEPAKIHNLAMKELINQNKTNSISKPIDPRKALSNKVENYSQLTSTLAVHWSSVYNVDIDTMPSEVIHVTKSFSKDNVGINDNGYGRFTGVFNYNDFEIPEFYQAVSVKGNVNADKGAFIGGTNHRSKFYICGQEIIGTAVNITLQEKVKDLISISGIFWDILGVSGTLVAKCELTSEGKSNWQKETFNKIIEAYETALENYNQVLASEQAMGVQILGTNPGFYREIENVILRKNCISYLISSNPNDKLTFGKNFYTQNVSASSLTFGNAMLTQNADLDNYASFVKFMEQAFEWEIMSYNFYPFYWGNRDEWGQTYQFEQTHDNLFKSFMQSGMARVIVTVRPGFEEAVRYYMQTGQIWSGGEVPVIGDKMFLSVVDELKKPSGDKRGKAWPTRVPTSMTILQAQSIGLTVTKALPSLDNELSDFENPAEVPQSSQIDIELDAQIGGANPTGIARLVGSITGNQGIEAKIVLKKIDGATQDITYCNTNGTWELNNIPAGRYELFLDANNDFPADTFEVTTGSKQQVVELEDGQVIEIDLTVAPV